LQRYSWSTTLYAAAAAAAAVVVRSITAYKGNYDVFVKTAAERLRNAQKAAEAQAAKRAHVQVQLMFTCRIHCVSGKDSHACFYPGQQTVSRM
jgi:hypothetical protein